MEVETAVTDEERSLLPVSNGARARGWWMSPCLCSVVLLAAGVGGRAAWNLDEKRMVTGEVIGRSGVEINVRQTVEILGSPRGRFVWHSGSEDEATSGGSTDQAPSGGSMDEATSGGSTDEATSGGSTDDTTGGGSGINPPPAQFRIKEDGVDKTYFIAHEISDDDSKMTLRGNRRSYLMNKIMEDYSKADDFAKIKLMGRTLSIDVDLTSNGPACGCNVAVYLVDMPWTKPGHFKDYYCDAQIHPDAGAGTCDEFDMMETNMKALQVTAHACPAQQLEADRDGCDTDATPKQFAGSEPALEGKNDFGPGSDYKIDTKRKFTFEQKFDENNDGGFTVTTTLKQDGRKPVVKSLESNELYPEDDQKRQRMLNKLREGMVLTISNWWYEDGDTMSWLDNKYGQCQDEPDEECNRKPSYLSNWRIQTNGGDSPGGPSIPDIPTASSTDGPHGVNPSIPDIPTASPTGGPAVAGMNIHVIQHVDIS